MAETAIDFTLGSRRLLSVPRRLSTWAFSLDDVLAGVSISLLDETEGTPLQFTVEPDKDVDGFHVANAGRLAVGARGAMVPCTPVGCMMMIKSRCPDLTGLKALVLGRSNIVGKPMANLLLAENCTVTVAHSKTRDLPAECRQADILVAAVGRARMVRGDWIKPGATVIDVGINRILSDNGKTRLVGDVDFNEALEVAGAITPVPGGVGPMTVACLLRNTLVAACRQRKIVPPEL